MEASAGASFKPKFRARKLDNSRPLAVYRYDTVDDVHLLEDFESGSSRSVPAVATGVDKEEEVEVHLQTAITAAQIGGERVVIPTPASNVPVDDYEAIYEPVAGREGSQQRWMPCPGMGSGRGEYVRTAWSAVDDRLRRIGQYNAVGEEEQQLMHRLAISQDTFELIVDCLRQSAARFGSIAVVGSESIERLRCDTQIALALPSDEIVEQLVEWWKEQQQHPGMALLRLEDPPGAKMGADPYVCFRRRQLRNQLRKTRRSDAHTADRIRRLHYDLEATRLLTKACIKRDQLQRESVRLEGRLFEAYRRLDGLLRASGSSLEELQQQRKKIMAPLAGEHLLPPIPPFKIAGQPIAPHSQPLEAPRRARPKKQQRAATASTAAAPSASCKISLPASAFKTLKYNRPHYPPDAFRSITRDIDALLAADLSCSLPNCTAIEGASTEDLAMASLLGMFGGSIVQEDQRRRRWASRLCQRHPRIGRSGRVLFDDATDGSEVAGSDLGVALEAIRIASDHANPAIFDRTSDSMTPTGLLHSFSRHYSLPRLRILPARDCAQLNNAAVGNLNQYYLSATAAIRSPQPYTLVEWIAATNGLLVSGSSANNYSITHRRSPQKKRPSTAPGAPSNGTNGAGLGAKGAEDGARGDANEGAPHESGSSTKRRRIGSAGGVDDGLPRADAETERAVAT